MLAFLNAPFINFNGYVGSSPAVEFFGFGITYYALIIVSGMVLAIIIFSFLLKRFGLNPDDSLDYAIWVLPMAVLGSRLYFFVFPYSDVLSDWSTFWDFRDGGLGIYGGVILGYLTVHIVAHFKMHNVVRITDYIAPGLLLAQSIGRWGNFINQEAYGNLITDPAWQWFPAAVKIGSDYYQATFFYESFFTLIGFIITFILITRWKNYKRGFNLAFYGVYYGIVRLFVEGLRTDSLFLWIRWGGAAFNTGIKISQLVSWIAISLGVIRFILIYTSWDKKFDAWYYKVFGMGKYIDKRVGRAKLNSKKLAEEAQSIKEQVGEKDRLYTEALKKAQYALLNEEDIINRAEQFNKDIAKTQKDKETLNSEI